MFHIKSNFDIRVNPIILINSQEQETKTRTRAKSRLLLVLVLVLIAEPISVMS